MNYSDLLATGNGTFNNGQMNGSGGSASNFPSVGNFEIGTFNISNSRGGGGGGKSNDKISKIRDIRMGRVSVMGISSSPGLKKPPKISPREEKLASRGKLLF